MVRVNGIELAFETRGEGPPLLLLHGMGGCAQDWRWFGGDALARAHRTIAVDARGHGHSTNDLPTLSHRQCAADVLALLDALGIARCAAIGLSMGGNTLLHVASLAPERIEAMVLVSATPRFGEQARALMRAVSSEQPLRRGLGGDARPPRARRRADPSDLEGDARARRQSRRREFRCGRAREDPRADARGVRRPRPALSARARPRALPRDPERLALGRARRRAPGRSPARTSAEFVRSALTGIRPSSG